ncbi:MULTISPECIES: HEPN/Toprim-associated domain-containing protein [Pseudomonas]|uniref:HEPN/Toprim-associated domain-containing protein n=1 Tax=Pseudomonas TaxID=286 RepID=UPI00102331D7|nr:MULTISPECIES: HEPN/Toprim-associated domain-containing protein [Pseudomonas]MBK3481149.1 hypothetical protein [Pseudomonas fluorescens]MEB0189825.1 HEPN/Toprim-associated domain-containing protein [Pseudomonas sp. CCI1.1]NMY93927.1 hypothetical protein [Pseudomonas proteolytica]RZI25627.1 hypothetical protein EUX58_09285 [Pseudomonas sp. 770NI]WPX45989.1 HEPN/Toprim-associated domain-containing protein [Pseudomonas sp. CCI1.1]
MSSWYDIKIQGFEVFSNSSQCFSEWYFQKSDRITREGNEANIGTKRHLYVTDAATARRRLALQGCDRRLLESEYERAIIDIEKEFEFATEYYPDDVATLRNAITGMTLDDWLSKLKVIVNEELDRRALHDNYQHTDAVINYLTSVGKWNSDNRYTSFPCITPDCYTLAVLEVTPDDAEVIMDCTDCVKAGSIAAFDTYIEYLQPRTYLYEIFKTSIHEIENIVHTVEVNNTLAKLLFAGVITALETYLSDTMRKLIFNNQAVIRRYVEFEDSFQKKIKISEIYLTLEKLEKDVSALLDKTSFHNIEETSKLYQNVLIVNFPREETLELKKAVEIRHDIVHRNGKTFKGEYRNITEQNVIALISSIVSFLEKIDDQIRNNLLFYENDNESDWSPNPRFQIIVM